MTRLEDHLDFHRARRRLNRVKSGAFNKMARWYKKLGLDESGNILAVLMIIISIISITSLTALGTLRREVRRVNKDYCELMALYTAESGIELAKRDIFASRKIDYSGDFSSRKLEFEYGGEYFPEEEGRIIKCRVIAYVHPERTYMESSAEIINTPVAEGRSHIVAKRIVRQTIRTAGSPPKLSIVWQVYK